MPACYDTGADERSGQLAAYLLQDGVRAIAEEGTEALEGRRRPIGVESEGGRDGRVLQQMGMEISQKAHASEPLIDTGFQQRLTICGSASGFRW